MRPARAVAVVPVRERQRSGRHRGGQLRRDAGGPGRCAARRRPCARRGRLAAGHRDRSLPAGLDGAAAQPAGGRSARLPRPGRLRRGHRQARRTGRGGGPRLADRHRPGRRRARCAAGTDRHRRAGGTAQGRRGSDHARSPRRPGPSLRSRLSAQGSSDAVGRAVAGRLPAGHHRERLRAAGPGAAPAAQHGPRPAPVLRVPVVGVRNRVARRCGHPAAPRGRAGPATTTPWHRRASRRTHCSTRRKKPPGPPARTARPSAGPRPRTVVRGGRRPPRPQWFSSSPPVVQFLARSASRRAWAAGPLVAPPRPRIAVPDSTSTPCTEP